MNNRAKRISKLSRFLYGILFTLIFYILAAYLILPDIWRYYEQHPEMAASPVTTFTREGIKGDPVNVGLAGSQSEVEKALRLAGWVSADPLKITTDFQIAKNVMLNRPYPSAPVSNLYLWGRAQDMAFEKPAGPSPKSRHHVRLWKSPLPSRDSRPLWIGSATYDRSVGFSRNTGKITHHIAPDIDRERDLLIQDLARAGVLSETYQVTGIGQTFYGRNGGGDRYYTDGEILVGVIPSDSGSGAEPIERKAVPPRILFKNKIWEWLHSALRK